MTDNSKVVMNKKSRRRLQKDIVDIIKNPLSDHGIYYAHDEQNMMRGYAIIFGPSDTIYRYGAYCFEFKFPTNYPFSPPKLKYMTNDGYTRFHPNLYRNGKVCLSILNTWKGEQWTSCQSIRSVLLTIISLFDNKPLLHEPGITEKYKDFDNYNNIIQYRNIEISILEYYKKKKIKTLFENENYFKFFYFKIKNNFNKEKDKILENINKHKYINCKTGIYNMSLITNKSNIIKKYNNILKKNNKK